MFSKIFHWIANAAVPRLAGMLGLGAAKLYLYGGLALAGLLAVLTFVWKVRQSGVEAERARQAQARLRDMAVKRGLDREIDALPEQRMQERAMRWARD